MEERKRKKNPTRALVLSALLPGLGQIYNDEIWKGLILGALNLVINFLLIDPLKNIYEAQGKIPDKPTLIIVAGYTIAGLILLIFAVVDAKRTAERINSERELV